MKKIYVIIILMIFYGILLKAQDTLYIYKTGSILTKDAVTNIDSITFSKENNSDALSIHKSGTVTTRALADIDSVIFYPLNNPLANIHLTQGWATFGLALPKGIASGAVKVDNLQTQTDVKTQWPDGSIKFAVITCKPTKEGDFVISATPTSSSASFSPLVPTASVELIINGVIYTAELPTTVSSDKWLSGSLVREWRQMVKPSSSGGSYINYLQVLFDIRTYNDGASRVDITVENIFDTADATKIVYDVTINVNGQSVFTKQNVNHYYLTRWRKFFSVNLKEASLVPDFTPYYQAKALPQYLETVTNHIYSLSGPTFDIMGRGGLAYDDMGSPGGRPDIAPYPDWVAEYLVHKDSTQLAYMLRTADLAGSQPIHIREMDNSLVSIDKRPQFWLDERGQHYVPESDKPKGILTGLGPLYPDIAHQPSLAYVPYLITGDRYYADEMKFWANYDLLGTHPYYDRLNSQGILASLQVRSFAWSLRDVADAASYLPDDDSLKSYLTEKVKNNLKWADDYVTGDAKNSSWLHHPNDSLGTSFEQTSGLPKDWGYLIVLLWQQNYLAWAITHANDQGFIGGLVLRNRIVAFENKMFNSEAIFPRVQAAPFAPVVGTFPVDGDHTNWNYYTTMNQYYSENVKHQTMGTTGDNPDPTIYGIDSRLSLITAIHLGLPGAQSAYDYLMSFYNSGTNLQSGFAIKPD